MQRAGIPLQPRTPRDNLPRPWGRPVVLGGPITRSWDTDTEGGGGHGGDFIQEGSCFPGDLREPQGSGVRRRWSPDSRAPGVDPLGGHKSPDVLPVSFSSSDARTHGLVSSMCRLVL